MQMEAEQSVDIGLLDGASGSPGEEANGPGARVCWVHHILVELKQQCLQQTYDASCQSLCHGRYQPAQLLSLSNSSRTATHEPEDQQNSTAGLAQDDNHCLMLGSSVRPSSGCQTGVARCQSQALTT